MHFLSNSFMQYEAQCWVKQKKHDTHQNRDNEKKNKSLCHVLYEMRQLFFCFLHRLTLTFFSWTSIKEVCAALHNNCDIRASRYNGNNSIK